MSYEKILQLGFVGDGQMSRAIQTAAQSAGHTVSSIIRRNDSTENIDGSLIYECALPEGVLERIKTLCDLSKDVVIVTTGWYDRLEEVRQWVEVAGNRVIWSSNYSIGVQLFFKIVNYSSQLFNHMIEYDIWGTELHHRNKTDSPSGTARTLGEIIINNIERKKTLVTETLHRKIKPEEIHFSSTRGGENNFSHTISFGGASDCITLQHSATNRNEYAIGAIKAGEWLKRQPPGFYSMEDFLHDLLPRI